jgi:hypothetical protein
MAWMKNIATGYHQQDTDYYCGAAVAQMILDEIGAGLIDQNVLYSSNHNHNTVTNWYTDPDGLNFTLNYYKPNPPKFNSYFVVFTRDSELEGTRKIVYTLWHYGVSTGTLVEACGHWIVVRGVSTDVEPVEGSNYSINGFWINNPWPPTPSFYNSSAAPPPPHSGSSSGSSADGCGNGGNRGVANEYAVYNSTWKDTYFTGCDVWGVGHNQYVSVCDPSHPKLGELILKRDQYWSTGERLATSEEASTFVLKGIDEHNLLQNKEFAQAIDGAKPTDPVLVQRLDLADKFYYLVPMIRNKEITAVLSVDALYGNFRGAHVLGKSTTALYIHRDEVMQKVIGKPIDLGQKFGRIVIREGAFCFYPTMVWRPCYESRSPFYPFHMITVGGRTIYVGFDGVIYPELHEMGRGA